METKEELCKWARCEEEWVAFKRKAGKVWWGPQLQMANFQIKDACPPTMGGLFLFLKKLQQKLVNCGSLKIIFSATVHRMAIILRRIDRSRRALHFCFWVRDDQTKRSSAKFTRNPVPGGERVTYLDAFGRFAVHRLAASNRTQKTFDRTFKELSNDVQFVHIRLKISL